MEGPWYPYISFVIGVGSLLSFRYATSLFVAVPFTATQHQTIHRTARKREKMLWEWQCAGTIRTDQFQPRLQIAREGDCTPRRRIRFGTHHARAECRTSRITAT
jgi:hypothetical protein